MASPDVWNIKERIVDILDSQSNLFDATGANDKVRLITSGAPRMRALVKETTLPQIWVTSEPTIDIVTRRVSVAADAAKSYEHIIKLKLIVIAQEKDGQKVEEVLDDFVVLIIDELAANYHLKTPAGADALVDSCNLERVTELDQSITGLSRQGRVLTLKCIKTT